MDQGTGVFQDQSQVPKVVTVGGLGEREGGREGRKEGKLTSGSLKRKWGGVRSWPRRIKVGFRKMGDVERPSLSPHPTHTPAHFVCY